MMIRLSRLIAVALLGVLISSAAFAETLRLVTRLTVVDEVITLGDVFGITGKGAPQCFSSIGL